jgi:hypothetical protein
MLCLKGRDAGTMESQFRKRKKMFGGIRLDGSFKLCWALGGGGSLCLCMVDAAYWLLFWMVGNLLVH